MKILTTYKLFENFKDHLDKHLFDNVEYINLYQIRKLLKQGAKPTYRDHNNWTALHAACIRFDKRFLLAIKYLLAAGADINAVTGNGNTPIMLAASYDELSNVQLLLKYKPDLSHKNNDGKTFLYYANTSHRISSWINYFDGLEEILKVDPSTYKELEKYYTIPKKLQDKYQYAKNAIDLNLL